MSPSSRSTRTRKTNARSGSNIKLRHNVVTSENDNLSKPLADLVPEEFRGTSRFLDVIQWNLEWFGAQKSKEKDNARYGMVLQILEALNGDLFIFQEVAGPSRDGRYEGAIDKIAEELTTRRAGDYAVFYTQAGGEQRVAMMWDREWLRAKTDVEDLFPRGSHKTADGKDAFAQRTPLYGYFTTRIPPAATEPELSESAKFDFQVLGVHLKAMVEGHKQRLESAKVLAKWMTKEAPAIDADVLIMGDWNAPADDKCWKPFHDLERGDDPKIAFRKINDPSDFSYLWLRNRSDKFVSRIDLSAISLASMDKIVDEAARVVRWKPIQEVLAEGASLTDKEVVKVMEKLKESISDHMPVVSRFYITE